MDHLSSFMVICDDHQGLGWVELLAELNDALQIVVENILVL